MNETKKTTSAEALAGLRDPNGAIVLIGAAMFLTMFVVVLVACQMLDCIATHQTGNARWLDYVTSGSIWGLVAAIVIIAVVLSKSLPIVHKVEGILEENSDREEESMRQARMSLANAIFATAFAKVVAFIACPFFFVLVLVGGWGALGLGVSTVPQMLVCCVLIVGIYGMIGSSLDYLFHMMRLFDACDRTLGGTGLPGKAVDILVIADRAIPDHLLMREGNATAEEGTPPAQTTTEA